ncbi:MAG TPA: DNA mismatch repair endonuclease MutL, partial [Gammaproteobacteria bacterium]|nr:DNA mismatch repair endonuclease MutL [Gammaproteobacteria bacterium]
MAMTTPPAIRRLSRQLANQIAAGEVVERPASILKELLENSLDAGARQIDIDAEQGGIKRLTVRDDGHGIAADELALAVSRHATSKIHSLADLQAIASLGFRGEALASIASVCQLRLVSRPAHSEQAWQLQIRDADQDPGAPLPAAHPPGTTVETRELFYNIPARRKFLRSERTEYRHLEEVVRRMALAHFGTGFRFRHNGREVFHLPPVTEPATSRAARERRLARLCGKRFVQQARRVEAVSHGSPRLRLTGWALPPEAARAQPDVQFFFVNGRIIRDRLVNHALREACAERIFPGRHPGWVLYLELDPAQVDVNVHPTKHEVRFREARQVHDFLSHALTQALTQALAGSEPEQVVEEVTPAWLTPAEGNAAPALRARGPGGNSPAALRESAAAYERLRAQAAAAGPASEAGLEPESESAPSAADAAPVMLACLGDCLLARQAEVLWLVDRTAAREALLGLQLQRYREEAAVSQPLLFPLELPLSDSQRAALQQHGAELAALGFVWQ